MVPIITDITVPAGMLGPRPVTYDVRCFALAHEDGITLLDTGFRTDLTLISDALAGLGAGWADVTDVILTHDHVDHVSGLPLVVIQAPTAQVWAGHGDNYAVPVRRLAEADVVRGLRVICTPGHTPGHISLLNEEHGVLFAGDVVGTMQGHLVLAPEQFTGDTAEAMLSVRKLAAVDFTRLVFSHGDELPHPARELAQLIARSDTHP